MANECDSVANECGCHTARKICSKNSTAVIKEFNYIPENSEELVDLRVPLKKRPASDHFRENTADAPNVHAK